MKRKATVSNMAIACDGALVAIAAVFAYSILVMIYVVIRSSVSIYNSTLIEERGSILFASGFSVAYSVTIFSLLMAVLSSVIGIVVAIVLKTFLLYFNPLHDFRKVLIISCTIAISTVSLIYFLLRVLLKDWMTYSYIKPFLFWFILPCVTFSIVCVISGIKLNEFLGRGNIGINKKSTITPT